MRTSSRTNSGLPSVDVGQPRDESRGETVGAEQPGGELLGGGGVEAVEREHVLDRSTLLGE